MLVTYRQESKKFGLYVAISLIKLELHICLQSFMYHNSLFNLICHCSIRNAYYYVLFTDAETKAVKDKVTSIT